MNWLRAILLILLPTACLAQSVVDPTSVEPFSVFTADVTGAGLDTLTVSATASDYDWSGICWQSVVSGTPTVNCQSSGVLVTQRHALGVWHCGPLVGDVCRWKAPDGSVKEATVQASTRVGTSDLRLIRFVSAPHASLKRYEVITEAADYNQQYYWAVQKTGVIALRKVLWVANPPTLFGHGDGGWGIPETSSGKPGVVPFDDGSLKVLGLASYTTSQTCIEGYIDTINGMLSTYGESLNEQEVPAEIPPTRLRLFLKAGS